MRSIMASREATEAEGSWPVREALALARGVMYDVKSRAGAARALGKSARQVRKRIVQVWELCAA